MRCKVDAPPAARHRLRGLRARRGRHRARAPPPHQRADSRPEELSTARVRPRWQDGSEYTDQQRHAFAGSTLPSADTPSLIGLAASAPYFHDGSAETLEALLRGGGSVHGMADTAKLPDRDIADLTAFLETL